MNRTRVLVTVWSLDVSAERFENLRAHLSPGEREYCGRIKSERVAKEFVVSRGVLRELLAFHCGGRPNEIVFGVGAAGKPFLVKPETSLAFNLSHSAGVCALAIGEVMSLGVDVEAIRPDFEDILDSVFGPKEAEQFHELSDDSRSQTFFRAWVAKEAYLKATGQGLAGGLTSLELDLGGDMQPIAIRGCRDALNGWVFRRFDISERVVGAIAADAGGASVELAVQHIDAERPLG